MARSLGRYELLRLLARGGMADVYLARRRGAAGVEKRLVLKRIRPERARDPRFLALFVKEARLSVDLAHANIVPVFDFGRVGDELFLAMEYVEGCDLAAALRRAGERGVLLDPVLVAHIGAEACKALDYAHRRGDASGRPLGIVHRDVTPRNVLLSFAGEVKLTDFGVASLAADVDERVRGTPAYMSPEQARGEPVDGRSDLFSLGLVLAEAATGERSYRAKDAAALLVEARSGESPPLPASVPAVLRDAITRALRAARDDRYPDARAMERALDAVVVGARASDPARPAPSHELAAWLLALFPEPAAERDAATLAGEDDGDAPVGLAVTLADDGEARVAAALGVEGADDDGFGHQTMRSMAETMGDETPRTRRPPWRLAIVVAAVLAAVTGAVWGVGRSASVMAGPDAPPVASMPPPRVAVPADAPGLPSPAAVAAPVAAAPPSRPSPPSAKKAPAAARLYPVELNSRPWARVFIDGRYVDDTPFRTELPAGSHRVRFENPQEGSSKTIVIDVPRDRPVLENLESP